MFVVMNTYQLNFLWHSFIIINILGILQNTIIRRNKEGSFKFRLFASIYRSKQIPFLTKQLIHRFQITDKNKSFYRILTV